MNKLKSIPAFETEAEERKIWETHDSTDYIDWSKAERARFPNLKPSTTAISIRLPLGLLEQIKIAIHSWDIERSPDVEQHRPGGYAAHEARVCAEPGRACAWDSQVTEKSPEGLREQKHGISPIAPRVGRLTRAYLNGVYHQLV